MRDLRRLGVIRSGCFVLAGVCLSPLLAPRVEAQSSVSAKRREAARLDARIETTAARLEVLNEDFLVATQRLAELQKKLARSERTEKQTTQRVEVLRARLHEQGLRMFTNPAGPSIEAFDNAATIADVERKLVIGEQRTQHLADAVDLLRAERADRERATRQWAAARREAKQTKATLALKRKKADALYVELQGLERQVSQELAGLIAADRKAREEAQRRALELAATRARERARAELIARQRAERDALLRRRTPGRRQPTVAEQVGRSTQQPRRDSAGSVNETGDRSLDGSSRSSRATRSAASERRSLEVEAGLIEVSSSPGANRAVSVAMSQMGKPYIWAAEGPHGYDCSGLMLYAWRAAGRSLPHSSRIQFASTTRVPLSQRRPGDLLFYGRPIHHVGMYIGNDQMVEAPHRGARVRVKSIFRRDFVGVGRV